jgi:hypothetical protein
VVEPPPPYGQPPYGQPQYGQPPYGQPQYGQPQYGQPQYGQPQYGQPYGQYPVPDPYYGGLAPKPGCIPLRPLSTGEIIAGTFSAISRNARLVFPISAAFAAVQALISVAAQLRTADLVTNGTTTGSAVDLSRFWSGIGLSLVLGLVGAVFATVLTGMLIVVVTEDVVGRRAPLSLLWSKVRSRMWRLVLLSMVVSVVPFMALFLCLVPGIWLWGIWALAVPAMMTENTGIFDAIGRSQALVRQEFWHVWGTRALGYLIAFGISIGIGLVFTILSYAVGGGPLTTIRIGGNGALTGSPSTAAVILLTIGSAVATAVVAPIKAATDSLLYVDQRMRRENLAPDLQRAAARTR